MCETGVAGEHLLAVLGRHTVEKILVDQGLVGEGSSLPGRRESASARMEIADNNTDGTEYK